MIVNMTSACDVNKLHILQTNNRFIYSTVRNDILQELNVDSLYSTTKITPELDCFKKTASKQNSIINDLIIPWLTVIQTSQLFADLDNLILKGTILFIQFVNFNNREYINTL